MNPYDPPLLVSPGAHLSMRLTLDRPLVFFDLETTGTRQGVDRIVQIAAQKVYPDGKMTSWQSLVNPGMPIPPRASEVHGITDEKVKDAPSLAVVGPLFARALEGSDVSGFNVRRFDWPFLLAEFERVKLVFTWAPRIVDAMAIYRHFHPRDLAAALATYVGREHTGAHDAMADVIATREVLVAQLEQHELPATVAAVEEMFVDPDEIDLGGKFKFEGEEAVITFGKYAGTVLSKVDRGFLEWMLRGDFAADAKHIAREALSGRFPTRTKKTEGKAA